MAVILVVEDRPEIQTLLCAVIGRMGHRAITARSAAEAIESLEKNPDLRLIQDLVART